MLSTSLTIGASSLNVEEKNSSYVANLRLSLGIFNEIKAATITFDEKMILEIKAMIALLLQLKLVHVDSYLM